MCEWMLGPLCVSLFDSTYAEKAKRWTCISLLLLLLWCNVLIGFGLGKTWSCVCVGVCARAAILNVCLSWCSVRGSSLDKGILESIDASQPSLCREENIHWSFLLHSLSTFNDSTVNTETAFSHLIVCHTIFKPWENTLETFFCKKKKKKKIDFFVTNLCISVVLELYIL